MMRTTPVKTPFPRATLRRRLLVLCYESVLLVAVLIGAGLLALAVSIDGATKPGNPYYQAYIFLVIASYFCWQWVRGGQTLAMKAWRMRLVTFDGGPPSWWHAVLRFLCAWVSLLPLGLGFWWALLDRDGLTWHDRFSYTMLVVEPR